MSTLAEFVVRVVGEFFFDLICGYVGSFFLRVVTFGRVDLHPTRGGESVLASVFGLFVILGVIAALVWLFAY